MLWKVILLLVGIFFITVSFFYTKEYHHKHFARDYSTSAGGHSDSILFAILEVAIGVFLSILPWYLIRILLILIGLSIIGLVIVFGFMIA